LLASASHSCFLMGGVQVMNQHASRKDAGTPVTVFVVDDEPMLLELAAAILKPVGFDVHTFRDPRLALKELPALNPAVIVTDYAMGEMNGMDLVRECKRINPRQKILLLSGTVTEDIFANAPQKPDCFMPKPFPVRKFVETIQALASA